MQNRNKKWFYHFQGPSKKFILHTPLMVFNTSLIKHLSVPSFYRIYRGYLLFWGEYQIYFIEWVENIRIFTSAQHEWKLLCFQLTRWNIFGIYRKKANFLFILYNAQAFSNAQGRRWKCKNKKILKTRIILVKHCSLCSKKMNTHTLCFRS